MMVSITAPFRHSGGGGPQLAFVEFGHKLAVTRIRVRKAVTHAVRVCSLHAGLELAFSTSEPPAVESGGFVFL
jgi:hypothetical protein